MTKGGLKLRSSKANSWWVIVGSLVIALLLWFQDFWQWPTSFRIPMTLLTAFCAPVWLWVKKRAEKQDDTQRVLRETSSTGVVSGAHPKVCEVDDAAAGVNRAIEQVAYQARDRQAGVVRLLGEGRPVLVCGPSLAGKTRMSIEVLRQHYPNSPMWLPRTVEDITDLMRGHQLAEGTVVWLNELDRFLVGDGFMARWLDEWAKWGCVVIATMRDAEREKLRPLGEEKNPAAQVLGQFEVVQLEHSQTEQDRIAEAVQLEGVDAGGVRRFGLGAWLGGGALAQERLDIGSSQHPHAMTVLRVAADWHRCGLRTISEETLQDLSQEYMRQSQLHNPEPWDKALTWVQETFGNRIALLMPEEDGLRLFDYILDTLPDQKIPQITRTRVVQDAPVSLLNTVAWDLRHRGHDDDAKIANQKAINTGPTDYAPWAMIDLGMLFAKERKVNKAAELYQQAIKTEHPEFAPIAMTYLGMLLVEEGKLGKAAELYQKAIDTGHPESAPNAKVFLGMVRGKEGKIGEAAELYQKAIDTGHPEFAPMAMFLLGTLRKDEGKLGEATKLHQQAINTADWELRRRGHDADANFYQQAINTGPTDYAPAETALLGMLNGVFGTSETD